MLCRDVQNYLSTAKGLPFFYIVGDQEYQAALEELKQVGLSIVRMSDFCPKDDKYPSVDDLVDYFRTSDVDYRDNKFVVTGLGEYLSLRGASIADKELRRLKNTTLGNARAVLLLRGVSEQAKKIINDDNRMIEQQRVYLSEHTSTNISVTNVVDDYGVVAKKGIKFLLRSLEDGACNNIMASSVLLFDHSIIPIATIRGAYSIAKLLVTDFELDESYGSPEQWEQLLKDLEKNNKSLSAVFKKNNIDDGVLNDLVYFVSGFEYRNWLAFLFLK